MAIHDELWTLVRQIPAGKVCSYGDLGKALPHPVSGLLVGRWMKSAAEDLPWWRVVGKDGALPIAKQSPEQAFDQEQRLAAEGIKMEGGRVPTTAFLAFSDLLEE